MDISRSSGSSTVLGFVLYIKLIKKQKLTNCGFLYGLIQHGSTCLESVQLTSIDSVSSVPFFYK